MSRAVSVGRSPINVFDVEAITRGPVPRSVIRQPPSGVRVIDALIRSR